MANRVLPFELAKQAVDAVNAAILGGFAFRGAPSAAAEAARVLNLNEKTLHSRLRTARTSYGLVPDAVTPTVEVEFTPPAKPRVIVRSASEAAPEGEAIRVCFVGDTHQQPGMSTERWRWIARHVGETRPDKVVHMGDLGEWASVSSHEKPGSLQQKLRPSFMNDLESVEAAIAEFDALAGREVPVHIVLGNHDERVRTFETGNAELEGALWPQFEDVLARYDWRVTHYRKYLFISGVGITHVPMHTANYSKPYNGKTLNPIANELVFSLVFAHTHRYAFLNVPKIGPTRKVQVLNVGSAMPHGYFPAYNEAEQGGYTWGVVDATLQGGHIVAHSFTPLTTLAEKYGD